ncbi:hypothetical protein J5N97_012669 [Dioscorea zingiberensis]|uniref:PHD finger protein ALFIN-LIKE n=1 Tax=Dioscorea zingiberensis TaxID=325984 RepID=A0A9D5CPH0_9LILI|nr:hypothetical protein J5N97_012669 [Dioscorea zingiberensis]
MDGGFNPRTAEDVFRDFRGRRAGLIKALTTDVERFYQLCDPEKENLCLYGLPNETWEVNLPAEEVPPELPEPALGINFARDGMNEKDWLALVAVHSDAWLLAVAFYFGARFGFDKEARPDEERTVKDVEYCKLCLLYCSLSNLGCCVALLIFLYLFMMSGQSSKFICCVFLNQRRLFHMINGLPTIYEVLTGAAKRRSQAREKTPNSSSKSKSNSKTQPQAKAAKMAPLKEDEESEGGEEEEEEDHGNTLCGACGENYATDEFWICCDVCEKWFHGKCVRITPARAEHIKQYKCPACSNKRARV